MIGLPALYSRRCMRISSSPGVSRQLPDDLRTLYQDPGGIPLGRHPAMRFIMRLMSPSEVAAIMAAIRQNFPGVLDKCAGLFWTDDNSNYAAAFLAPPLLGRVFFLKRDEPRYTLPGSEVLSPSASR